MSFTPRFANRIGFTILGLTNNFAYVIMLSAAYDLLSPRSSDETDPDIQRNPINPMIANLTRESTNVTEPYCNKHSTSTILLADTLPSLTLKIIYPFLLMGLSINLKAGATAILSATSFMIVGLSNSTLLVFTGVIFASLSSGLGESTYLSNTPIYGDEALSGWSIGTGGAGLLGSAVYALLRMILPTEIIMLTMLVVPVLMMYSYCFLIIPLDKQKEPSEFTSINRSATISSDSTSAENSVVTSLPETGSVPISTTTTQDYGINETSLNAKLRLIPSLSKYFMPLLLVYFAEYFINQGLFELIYFPEVKFLEHKGQYRWFQVSYQLGVMVSRSTLDFFRIKQLWTMSILQAFNAALFLAHASKLFHIPSFYIVIGLIIYEGLLGGFTYVNTFYKIKKDIDGREKQEFCISTVSIADSLGIVIAGLTAIPVHDKLCRLYE